MPVNSAKTPAEGKNRSGARSKRRRAAKAPPRKKRLKIGGSKGEPKGARRRRSRKQATPFVWRPGPPIDGEGALDRAIDELIALDPVIAERLAEVGARPPLRRRDPGFAGLVWIIVSQQVSTASGNAIFKRVESGLAPLSAKSVLAADDSALRACGLSAPKMRALRALAHAVEREGLDLAGLAALSAEDAHRTLVAIKGVGPWTAEIFLLFCLGHADAFPAGDLALQEAARLALGLKRRPDERALNRIAERWRPLRGVAARILWAYYRFARKGREGMTLAGA
jgi:DNA-3-methyladenine glycosylase II